MSVVYYNSYLSFYLVGITMTNHGYQSSMSKLKQTKQKIAIHKRKRR